jgi:hypothetical protein
MLIDQIKEEEISGALVRENTVANKVLILKSETDHQKIYAMKLKWTCIEADGRLWNRFIWFRIGAS